MTTVYLHIGMEKTGTTFIQSTLVKNNNILEKQGYIFPDFGIRFPKVGKNRNGHFILKKDEKEYENIYKNIINKIKKLSEKYSCIILSDEAFWNSPTYIEDFKNELKKINIVLKVVVYLRRQDLFLQSIWAQIVKSPINKCSYLSFNKYLKENKKCLYYYKRCCEIRDIVEKDNIIVRVYEKEQFKGKNKDLLSDFLDAIGYEYNEKFVISENTVNPSLSGIYLEVKNMLNRNEAFGTYNNFIIKYLFEVAKERGDLASYSKNMMLTYKEQIKLISKYEEDNRKVAKEFLGRKDGILFTEKIENNKDIEKPTYKREDYIDVLAKIIVMQQQEIESLRPKVTVKKIKQTAFGRKIRKIFSNL